MTSSHGNFFPLYTFSEGIDLFSDFRHRGPLMPTFDVFPDVDYNSLLNKQLSWFVTHRRSLDRVVMGKITPRSSYPTVPVGFDGDLVGNSLRWRHNERDGVSIHRHIDRLFHSRFRRWSKKTSKVRDCILRERNPSATGGFPSQRASNAENDAIMWIIDVGEHGCWTQSTASNIVIDACII